MFFSLPHTMAEPDVAVAVAVAMAMALSPLKCLISIIYNVEWIFLNLSFCPLYYGGTCTKSYNCILRLPLKKWTN